MGGRCQPVGRCRWQLLHRFGHSIGPRAWNWLGGGQKLQPLWSVSTLRQADCKSRPCGLCGNSKRKCSIPQGMSFTNTSPITFPNRAAQIALGTNPISCCADSSKPGDVRSFFCYSFHLILRASILTWPHQRLPLEKWNWPNAVANRQSQPLGAPMPKVVRAPIRTWFWPRAVAFCHWVALRRRAHTKAPGWP